MMKKNTETPSQAAVSTLPDFSKRRLLQAALTLGVVSSSSVLSGCSTVKGLFGGTAITPERVVVREQMKLDATQRAVFEKLATVLLPVKDSGFPSLSDVNYIENVETILSQLSEADRENVYLGLSWFNLQPVFSWRLSSFSNMADASAEKHIARWQEGFAYQQGVVNTLYAVALSAYWRNDRTGQAVGYSPMAKKELPSLPIF